jgi:hypothetical protein
MDNLDHNESTLSGISGCHDTVMVLSQNVPADYPKKMKVSDCRLQKSAKRFTTQLPSQKLQQFHRKKVPITLPEDFSPLTIHVTRIPQT